MLAYLPDGYTEQALIAERAGFYPAVRFEFRPMLVEHRAQIGEAAKRPEGCRVLAAAIEQRLLSWDVHSAEGGLLPINAGNLLRLRPELFYRLYLIVAGLDCGDVDPAIDTPSTNEAAQQALEAAIRGISPAEVREEHDLKNFAAG